LANETAQFYHSSVIGLTLSSPVLSNGYTSKCSGRTGLFNFFLTFWHSPNVKKIKMVG